MTFSIVARDPQTGAFGVATATGGPNVGALVPHARTGVGAIATQSFTNPLYGYEGLDLLEKGHPAGEVLEHLLAADEGRERRQCVIIGATGSPAAWTGGDSQPAKGHFVEAHFAVAGNLLESEAVLPAIRDTFLAASGELEERILLAMAAGEAEGGDRRGTKSAAIKIFTTEPYAHLDLRVDWSEKPFADLKAAYSAVRETEFQAFLDALPRSKRRRSN